MHDGDHVRVEAADPLWAIACYFNPSGSARRLSNFRTFRRRLGARLVAVELSFDGGFDLVEEDADRLLRVHGGDRLWQKERLLSLALGALPDDCEHVAWLDADIVFHERDWAERVRDALGRHAVVQVFDRLEEPGPGRDGAVGSRVSLAAGLQRLLVEGRRGLVHVVNGGPPSSRYEVAKAVVEDLGLQVPIEPVTSAAFSPKIALRSRSSGASSVSDFGVIFPTRISPGFT